MRELKWKAGTAVAMASVAMAVLAIYGARSVLADGQDSGRNEEMAESSKKWEKSEMTDEQLRAKLTPEQYHVTQEDGTERPFQNEYWDNHREGIYVDVASGEPLFSSRDKYKSGTGWPSFTQPLVTENLVEKKDRELWAVRTEIRSKNADSHLGHVFNDGPAPTGLRYCMNSAALRFVPVGDLEKEGYGEFLGNFEERQSE